MGAERYFDDANGNCLHYSNASKGRPLPFSATDASLLPIFRNDDNNTNGHLDSLHPEQYDSNLQTIPMDMQMT